MSVPRVVFLVFIVLQYADGLITYQSVRIFGPSAEANQLIVTWASLAGLGATIFSAKALACGCGAILYVFRAHRALAGLTAIYLVGAIVPWLYALESVNY